ncbi:MAG: hypothetical protein AB7S75_06830 [Desulfococcaceae bacterium]
MGNFDTFAEKNFQEMIKAGAVTQDKQDEFENDGVKKAFAIPENYRIPVFITAGYFKISETHATSKWLKTFEEFAVKSD